MTEQTLTLPVFHITHWKAGSQWVRAILVDLFPERAIEPYEGMQHGLFREIVPGEIYSPVYVPKHKFDESPAAASPHRKFLVTRDLRDTLVSWYFSLKFSHPSNHIVEDHRLQLQDMPVEDALVMLIDHPHFASVVRVPATWAASDIFRIGYEDLLKDPAAGFRRILDHCDLDVPDERLEEAIARQSFEAKAGRAPGQEDPASHFRKGVVGDWRNHFTPAVRQAFNIRWGHLLVKLGYEKSGAW